MSGVKDRSRLEAEAAAKRTREAARQSAPRPGPTPSSPEAKKAEPKKGWQGARPSPTPALTKQGAPAKAWNAAKPKATPVVRAATPAEPKPVPETADELKQTPVWNELSPAVQRRIAAMTSAEGMLRVRSRLTLRSTISDPTYAAATPQEQAARITEALNKPPAIPALSTDELVRRPPPIQMEVTEPMALPEFDFGNGVKAAAKRYEVKIDGRTIPVVVPDAVEPPGKQFSISDVAAALSDLPPIARGQVARVVLAPEHHKADAEMEKVYGKGFSAFATCGPDGLVTVYPRETMPSRAVLTSTIVHESGHSWSLREWGEHDSKQWQTWKAAAASDGIAPSVYGKQSLDEDLAEAWVLYIESEGTPMHDVLREMMPNRFKLLDEAVASGILAKNPPARGPDPTLIGAMPIENEADQQLAAVAAPGDRIGPRAADHFDPSEYPDP